DAEAADLLAERGTYLVADIYNGDYIAREGARQGWPAETLAKNEAITKAQRDGFELAVKAGVKIAYGTDSGVYPHGWNARQLPYMVRHGMTRWPPCARPRWSRPSCSARAVRSARWAPAPPRSHYPSHRAAST